MSDKPLGILINELFGGHKQDNYLRTDKCPKQDKPYGCTGEALEPHTCPYRRDVDDDEKTLCTCCSNCQDGCCDDI